MSPTIKTQGIVLTSVKYGEGSIIVNILTEQNGRVAYMVKVSGKDRRTTLPLMQPLTIVDLEAYHNHKVSVQKIKEVHVSIPLTRLPFDPVRRSIGMFITELIAKSLRNEIADGHIYEYVRNSILALDEGMEGLYNFHLYFMFKLTRLLGFEPDMTYQGAGAIFDLVDGVFTQRMPLHNHILSGTDATLWQVLATMDISHLSETPLSRIDRQNLISMMEQYYMLHIPGFQGLNSASVLAAIN